MKQDNETQKKRVREAPISYRPPKDLRAEFDARVSKSGLTVSAFLTKAIFDQEPGRASRKPSVEAKEIVRLAAEVAKLADQIRNLEANNALEEHLKARALMDVGIIRSSIMTALGRPKS